MAPEDPTPDDVDEPEADLLPEDPAEGLVPDDPAEGLVPEAPRVRDTSKNDADPELQKQFWSLVLLFNVALFATSLGVMLVGFQGRWTVGGTIFAVGAVAFARGWLRYKKVTGESSDDD